MRTSTQLLLGLVVGLMMADAFTTYIALASASQYVYEANPIAAFVFSVFGVARGIIWATVASVAAATIVACSHLLEPVWRNVALGCIATATAAAVVNNCHVLMALGLM